MLALLEAAGAFLLALVGIFAAGRLWFALVEAVKDGGPGLEILPVHYQTQA